mmetsp:Transcript_56928/g.123188  ORF Transcript_56928/g.123188 Transcript_56928/m.123188 type:complete len:764 (-) Transcript_56928:83-2374(-)|eukprot:CAMPEP_0170583826 /NCGR_PEP_ID=MMETSP0224-20130122/8353_1 /TAXON_ID=285029 /ORGANISM="Togula jolla, Strain CCCM 725" /LENGTH=763 /DNA_ID=CAMNT_0010907201 /DNA_START=66 /DNA_END=2357 /DNA_ORIENTATION=+
MAFKKASTNAPRGLVRWLLLAICVLQVIYQGLLWYHLQREEASDTCVTLSGPAPAGSAACLEADLFRSWQESEELHGLGFGESEAELHGLMEEIHPEESFGANIADQPLTEVEQIWEKMDAPDEASREEAASATGSNLAAAENASQVKHADVWAEFHRLADSVQASLANRSNVTSWARDLVSLQQHLQARMDGLLGARVAERPSAQSSHASAVSEKEPVAVEVEDAFKEVQSSLTPWGKDLVALQERLEARAESLRKAHNQVRAPAATVADVAPEAAVEIPLIDRINALGRDLCSAPQRRERPACKQFLEDGGEESSTTSPQLGSRRDLQAGQKAWQKLLAGSVAAFGRDLCAELHWAGYPPCSAYLNASSNGTEVLGASSGGSSAGASLRKADGYMQRLQWSTVPFATKHRRAAAAAPVVLTREQLRSAKWQGKIPSVACIAVIPSAKDVAARLKYFINNFQLQSYEGPQQLVLVYLSSQEDVAKLVKMYADGAFIKAVAVHSAMALPSTTAFRYGAWQADADVIARWNFDEWHHPQRLSMQVRALALAGRPACLITQWTVLSEAGLDSSASGWEGSLVGETAWMQEHWHPLLLEERVVLEGAQSHNVVRVDMPGLSVYAAEESHEAGGAISSAGSAGGQLVRQLGLPSLDVEEATMKLASSCLEIGPSGSSEGLAIDEALQARIGEQLGEEMATKYRELSARRQRVLESLQSVCANAALEKDPEKKMKLQSDASHIAAIKAELDQHFESVGELYPAQEMSQ